MEPITAIGLQASFAPIWFILVYFWLCFSVYLMPKYILYLYSVISIYIYNLLHWHEIIICCWLTHCSLYKMILQAIVFLLRKCLFSSIILIEAWSNLYKQELQTILNFDLKYWLQTWDSYFVVIYYRYRSRDGSLGRPGGRFLWTGWTPICCTSSDKIQR